MDFIGWSMGTGRTEWAEWRGDKLLFTIAAQEVTPDAQAELWLEAMDSDELVIALCAPVRAQQGVVTLILHLPRPGMALRAVGRRDTNLGVIRGLRFEITPWN